MVFQGHIENGVVIPHGVVPLPDGTQVTIMVREESSAISSPMSETDQQRYFSALAKLDSIANENPGDAASGAHHDRYLYGDKA
jgi:hypothetical protein